jgi:hypothetical protein
VEISGDLRDKPPFLACLFPGLETAGKGKIKSLLLGKDIHIVTCEQAFVKGKTAI